MHRREILGYLAATLLLSGGCLAPFGANVERRQERQLEESRATEAVAESATKSEGPAPVVVNQGDSSTATIAPPQAVKYEHTAKKGVGENRALETSASAWLSQRNPWTLILYGVGLAVIVLGLKKVWNLIRNTALGQAAKAADEAGRAVITQLKRKMQQETNSAKLDALKDAVIEAEDRRAEVVPTGSK